MGDDAFRGKNIDLVAREIADGYAFVNPIFLKKFNEQSIKKLIVAVNKTMVMTRNEKYPTGDFEAMRIRNSKLSRLNNALVVMKHYAKTKRWMI
jgi:hypothetical protein